MMEANKPFPYLLVAFVAPLILGSIIYLASGHQKPPITPPSQQVLPVSKPSAPKNEGAKTTERTFEKRKYISYMINAGDTLSQIALESYGNRNLYPLIADENPGTAFDPDHIRTGQILQLPWVLIAEGKRWSYRFPLPPGPGYGPGVPNPNR
jgi:nucleoid-associated protein YgaU